MAYQIDNTQTRQRKHCEKAVEHRRHSLMGHCEGRANWWCWRHYTLQLFQCTHAHWGNSHIYGIRTWALQPPECLLCHCPRGDPLLHTHIMSATLLARRALPMGILIPDMSTASVGITVKISQDHLEGNSCWASSYLLHQTALKF